MISDFRLLRFFHVLMETRSLTATSCRLGMNLGVANRSLARLRDLSGDTLFIKAGAGMTPTAYAEGLSQRILEAIPIIDSLFIDNKFSPKETEREFNIFSSDNGLLMVVSRVLDEFRKQAPKASINIAQQNDLFLKRLQDGEMDLAVFSNPLNQKLKLPSDFHEATLFEVDLVHVVSKAHPLAAYAKTSKAVPLNKIRAYQRIEGGTPMLPKHSDLFSTPLEQGLFLRSPHFLATALILESTDLITLLPRSTAEHLSEKVGLVILESDPAPQRIRTRIIWHHRAHYDPALIWLRGLFTKTCFQERGGVIPSNVNIKARARKQA